jgi:hypothetical protein
MQQQSQKIYLKTYPCPSRLHYLDCRYLKNKIEEYSKHPYYINEPNKIKLLLTVVNNINKYAGMKEFQLMTRKDQIKFLLKEAIQDNPNISTSIKNKRGLPDKMESHSLTKTVLTNILKGGRRQNKSKKSTKNTKNIKSKKNTKTQKSKN